MSEQSSTEVKPPTVKKTPEELAIANALKIFNSGKAVGKSEGKSEQRDPLRKRLSVMLNTIAVRKEKGKSATFKQIKTKYNAVDDDRENYIKVKGLYETVGLYLSALDVPDKKTSNQSPPEPSV